jgi:hypothetical protein
VSPAVVGHEFQEDFASEAVATVAQPAPATAAVSALVSSSEPALPSTLYGVCVNCGREVALRVVATEVAHRTYQWVPASEPARQGRRCSEASMPAYHWADGATAAVYRVST